MRRDDTLTLSKSGDTITINSDSFDFSTLPDGATIDALNIPCEFIVDKVERVSNTINITIILPHGSNPNSNVAFPTSIDVTVDGPITLPE